jgi:hypothetical protein
MATAPDPMHAIVVGNYSITVRTLREGKGP